MSTVISYTKAGVDSLIAGLDVGGGSGSSDAATLYVEDIDTPSGTDDSTLLATAISTAISQNKVLRLRPGVEYRAKGLNPTGATIDMRGAGIKHPDGGTADNIFEPTGAWQLIGDSTSYLDGNKTNTTNPGVNTSGCGIYQFNASGWSGVAAILGGLKIHDCWQNGLHAATDTTSVTDAANAPDAALYAQRLITYSNGTIGQRFTGIGNLILIEPETYSNGSHGGRFFLCRRVTVERAYAHDNLSGHGMSSLYCYDQLFSGRFNGNGTDGLVFGGDSTSTTNQPGRYIRIPNIECNDNGNIGLCFDATITGSHDPVPVWAQCGIVHADGNTNEGVIVNSSQWVWFDSVFTDNNGGHGIQFASRNCGFGFHHAHGNSQKPLALQGNSTDPNWGAHWIGQRDYANNTPDDTNTIGTVVAESVWAVTATSVDKPAEDLGLANMAPGTLFTVIYDGTNWTYAGATVTARPSARTDLTMVCINATDSTVPAWALDGDILWKL